MFSYYLYFVIAEKINRCEKEQVSIVKRKTSPLSVNPDDEKCSLLRNSELGSYYDYVFIIFKQVEKKT